MNPWSLRRVIVSRANGFYFVRRSLSGRAPVFQMPPDPEQDANSYCYECCSA